MAKRTKPEVPTEPFWALVDVFRNEKPHGWSPREISFELQRKVRAAGVGWRFTRSIGVDQFSDTLGSTVYLSGDVRLAKFGHALAFLRRVERRLKSEGYSGHVAVDQAREAVSLSLYFTKALPDVESVRTEIVFLGHFELWEPT